MYLVLRIVRAVCGLIAALQIFGLLPVLGWLQNLGAVTGDMWAVVVAKLLLLFVFGGIFFGLRSIINRSYLKAHGASNQTRIGLWSL